jgi:hypothetical protein
MSLWAISCLVGRFLAHSAAATLVKGELIKFGLGKLAQANV